MLEQVILNESLKKKRSEVSFAVRCCIYRIAVVSTLWRRGIKKGIHHGVLRINARVT